MGLQDRDYYWEKYDKLRAPKKPGGSLKYLLFPALMLGSLWFGADALLKQHAKPPPIEAITGGVVLKSDRQGHFRGTALINNVPMPFLIDTGATTTTIPKAMATDAGLPFGHTVEAQTAGGTVYDRATRISSLKIGNAEIKNLDAHINDHIDYVLIGMNTLKHFRMTQSGNTLTLTANAEHGNEPAMTQPINRPLNDTPTIRKAVICDAQNNCKTLYSDR